MTFIRRIGNDNELDRVLNRDFVSFARSGYVEVGDDNFCLPINYEDCEETLREFEVRNDDVFLCGHPKTGTTWAQEMIWLIVHSFDYETAANVVVYLRFPQLEIPAIFDLNEWIKRLETDLPQIEFFDSFNHMKSPRCIKSHLHWSLLPEQMRNGFKQPKIITILRNAEDTCVSLYYHSQMAEGYKGTFEDFCELFLAGRVCFGPFWKQVLSFWNVRHRPNVLIIKYKDMKENLPEVIKAVAKFLEKPITDEQLEKLVAHLSFESMKNNPAVNYGEAYENAKKAGMAKADNNFIRSGKVGGYKAKMSPEMVARFEAWTKDNLEGTGLDL